MTRIDIDQRDNDHRQLLESSSPSANKTAESPASTFSAPGVDDHAESEETTSAELADTIERAWLTRWGRVPVVAAVVLHSMRRGG